MLLRPALPISRRLIRWVLLPAVLVGSLPGIGNAAGTAEALEKPAAGGGGPPSGGVGGMDAAVERTGMYSQRPPQGGPPSPAAGFSSASGEPPPHETLLDDGWRLGIGYTHIAFHDGKRTGNAAVLTIGKGALIHTETGARWDFEVGVEQSATAKPNHPIGPTREEVKVKQTALYYQARRLFGGSGWYLGWHIALSRVTRDLPGGESDWDLNYAFGPVAGWIDEGRLTLRIEALAHDPGPSSTGIDYTVRESRAILGVRF